MADPTASLADPVDLDTSVRARGGLLAGSKPIPGGVTHDVIVRTMGCVEPIVRDKCVTDDVDDAARAGENHVFKVFPIESASECSTIGGVDNAEIARLRLEGTTEWAMGRQLSENIVGNDSPSLADATVLGTVADADFTHAVSCLEGVAAETGFGVEWVLHAPVRAAAYLARDYLLVGGKSPAGADWIISPGYAPVDGTTVRLWATGRVWAGVDQPDVKEATGRRLNTTAAYALRSGQVAFDPCLLIAIDVTVPACPIPPGS